MQVWNVLHAARWKYRPQNVAKNSPSAHHSTNLSGCIFTIKACIDNWEKNLINSHISFRCLHHMANFGAQTAEIGLPVWGTPANFNGFCVLAALLHATLVMGVSQTVALNRGRHLYSAGRPSPWALAHICSFSFVFGTFLFRLNYSFLWSPYVYIFSCCGLFFFLSSFFPRLISAAADWMSAILPHMVWP